MKALTPRDSTHDRPRSTWTVALATVLALALVGFVALGVWQLQRMAWKHALIARVDARVHAEPVAPPARRDWARVSDARDGYRRVALTGRFIAMPEMRAQAVTELGAGHWSMAALQTDQGDIVWVNRGFVPLDATGGALPEGLVKVTGLLRMSEPVGGFLRRNDPANGRWYSRDVVAMAASQGLSVASTAPYFVDAATVTASVQQRGREAAPAPWPRAGMTVVRFRDPHLTYALTWFGMALLTAFAAWRLVVSGRRLRQDRGDPGGFDHAGAIPQG